MTTGKGTTYYVDHINRTTSFQDPRLSQIGIVSKPAKKKRKLPKYKDNLYSKIRRLLAELHEFQADDGSIEIAVSRETLFEDSYELIVNLDSLTLTRRLFINFKGEEYFIRFGWPN